MQYTYFRLHYAFISTFGFLPPSLLCSSWTREKFYPVPPLSCQASINSFHSSILLTFLKLGTCKVCMLKVHCCRWSHSGADLPAQATSRGYLALSISSCCSAPTCAAQISDFLHSFSTLLLIFSGKYSGLYVPGREDDLAKLTAWEIWTFHTVRISCLASSIIHGQGWLIRAA